MKIEINLPKVNLKKSSYSLKESIVSGYKTKCGKAIFNTAVGFSFFVLTILCVSALQLFRSVSYADTDIAAIVTQNGYYINATSDSLNGSINMNVNATASGTMAVAKDTLNVKSNVPEGYNVYVAMGRDDECASNCNALKKEESSAMIPATAGTFASPTTLSPNTWGFAIPKEGVGAPANNFNYNYNPSVPDSGTVWAALPIKGNDQLIQSIDNPNSEDGIDADVFYGINVNTTKESGIYRGVIAYSIVAKNGAGVAEIASVTPDATNKLEGGEILTIATNYTFTPENAGNISVYLNSLTSSRECTNVTKTTVNGALQLTCVAPAYETGKYDVRILIPNYSKDITLTRAVTYYIDSAEAKNLRTAVQENFDSETLSATVPNEYYGGNNTLPLSDVVDTYTTDYDRTKPAAENTEEAGVTWSADDNGYYISEGYHSAQFLPGRDAQNETPYVYEATLDCGWWTNNGDTIWGNWSGSMTITDEKGATVASASVGTSRNQMYSFVGGASGTATKRFSVPRRTVEEKTYTLRLDCSWWTNYGDSIWGNWSGAATVRDVTGVSPVTITQITVGTARNQMYEFPANPQGSGTKTTTFQNQ